MGTQVALGVALLSAAGLLARSIQHLYATPRGIAPGHVLAFRIQTPPYRRGTARPGVRMALGADPRGLLRFVLRQGLQLTGIGGAVGFAAALAVTPLLRSLLYGVSPSDPLTYALVAVGAAILGVVASYRPARRAAATDPMTSLQADRRRRA